MRQDTVECAKDTERMPPHPAPYLSDYSIQVFDMPRMTERQVENFTSDFKIVADYFMKKAEHRKDFNEEQPIKHVDAMLKMIEVLTGDSRFMTVAQKQREGEPTMCELLDELIEDGKLEGRLEGKREGRLEGKREGRLEGKKEGLYESIHKLSKNLGITIEEACRVMEVSLEEYLEGERLAKEKE